MAMSISREDYRNTLIPYVDKLIGEECDEVLFSIAAELGVYEIVEAGGVDVCIPLLEKLAKSDETVVREQAAISINQIADQISEADI